MEKSDKRTRKLLKNLTDIIFVIMIAVLAIIYLPGLAGYKGYCVLSASMQPKYSVGSMVYVRHADMQDITTGDVITFYINEDTLVTHRVVGKESESGGFLTKGDANEVNDGGTVLYDNIVGKVAFSIPLLGYVSSWEKAELRKAEKTMSVIIENKDDIAKIMAQILFDNENKKEDKK